ncbi:MAG: helix-turn-helix transcriptional regulator, partial [bacterium]|nr:helix-turn-helix transcriptional regulator [bacterium]
IMTPFNFLIGPLFYLYGLTLTRKMVHIEKKYLLHFIPFLAFVISKIPFYFMNADHKLQYLKNIEDGNPSLLFIITGWIVVLYGPIYIIAMLRLLAAYKKGIRNYFSDIKKVNLMWLGVLTVMGLCLYISDIIIHSLHSAGIVIPETLTEMTNLGVTFFVYTSGYFTLRQPQIFIDMEKLAQCTSPQNNNNSNNNNDDKKRSEKHALPRDTQEQCLKELERLMKEEKPYKDPDLTLKELAESLSISPYNLSFLMNDVLKQNFYNYINRFRVEEVQRALQNSSSKTGILDIAFDAGFNSKSTFNAIFKQVSGVTPSQFRKKVGA